jgi:hypothetical protein
VLRHEWRLVLGSERHSKLSVMQGRVLEMHEWSARGRGKKFPEGMPGKGEK